jgi:hypothetical protein
MRPRLRRSSRSTTRIGNSLKAADGGAIEWSREINHAFGVAAHYSWGMLFLAAFNQIWAPREQEAEGNDLLAESHAALGHLGLTVIALVFVLITFWKS